MSGAEPWNGSNMDGKRRSGLRLALAARPRLPARAPPPEQVRELEVGLRHLVDLLDVARSPAADRGGGLVGESGAGAAGGLGFACRWLGARRVAGRSSSWTSSAST